MAAAVAHLRRSAPLAAVTALALLGAAPQAAIARHCHNASANPNSGSIRAAQRATLCLINNRRRHQGLRPLRENRRLTRASARHARDMARHNYFAHGNFVGRIRAAHYFRGARSWYVGENIAWGAGRYARPAATVRMWMNSPPHRHNILSRGFREIGLGIARGAPVSGVPGGATYATDFGARG